MKPILGWALLLSLYACWSISCHKREDCSHPDAASFAGEWIWVKSVGGFGGWTLTPESTNTTKRLKIDDFTYRLYENDTLRFEAPYDLEIRPDTVSGTDKFVRLSTGQEWAVKIGADTLEVYELCADCFGHTYVRKR